MHDQRNQTQDAVLRAQIAMANRLVAEQSATIARAHSAIERAIETLREPDGDAMPRLGRRQVIFSQKEKSTGDQETKTILHSNGG